MPFIAWQSKTLFLAIFDPCLWVVKSVLDSCLCGVKLEHSPSSSLLFQKPLIHQKSQPVGFIKLDSGLGDKQPCFDFFFAQPYLVGAHLFLLV